MKITLCALSLTCALSAQPAITLTSQPVKAGATATITVTLSGATTAGISALQWFTPALPGMAFTSAVTGKLVTCQAANGLYGCVVYGGTNSLADGVLATITLPAPALPVALPLTALLGVDATGSSGIPVKSGAALTLTPINQCDVTGDGTVDASDAANVALQLIGVLPQSADIDGDGKTTLLDLQRIVNAGIAGGSCRTGL